MRVDLVAIRKFERSERERVYDRRRDKVWIKKEKKVRTRSTYYSALSQKKYYSALIWILEHNYGILQILNRDREPGMGFIYLFIYFIYIYI